MCVIYVTADVLYIEECEFQWICENVNWSVLLLKKNSTHP